MTLRRPGLVTAVEPSVPVGDRALGLVGYGTWIAKNRRKVMLRLREIPRPSETQLRQAAKALVCGSIIGSKNETDWERLHYCRCPKRCRICHFILNGNKAEHAVGAVFATENSCRLTSYLLTSPPCDGFDSAAECCRLAFKFIDDFSNLFRKFQRNQGNKRTHWVIGLHPVSSDAADENRAQPHVHLFVSHPDHYQTEILREYLETAWRHRFDNDHLKVLRKSKGTHRIGNSKEATAASQLGKSFRYATDTFSGLQDPKHLALAERILLAAGIGEGSTYRRSRSDRGEKVAALPQNYDPVACGKPHCMYAPFGDTAEQPIELVKFQPEHFQVLIQTLQEQAASLIQGSLLTDHVPGTPATGKSQ